LIADSLTTAWQRSADPFAPLRSIPGIAWRAAAGERRAPARNNYCWDPMTVVEAADHGRIRAGPQPQPREPQPVGGG
jgi:hypothetical protein